MYRQIYSEGNELEVDFLSKIFSAYTAFIELAMDIVEYYSNPPTVCYLLEPPLIGCKSFLTCDERSLGGCNLQAKQVQGHDGDRAGIGPGNQDEVRGASKLEREQNQEDKRR